MSDDRDTLVEAEEGVAAARAEVDAASGESVAELSSALLTLSRVLKSHDRTEDAYHAAREAVEVLAPHFLDAPMRLATPMRAAVAEFVALSETSGRSADRALLAPIAQALGTVTRNEDDIDESQW